jgi:hypothetical protein
MMISVLSLLLLTCIAAQAQTSNFEFQSTLPDLAETGPGPLVMSHRDSSFKRAYSDVFAMLHEGNSCSQFYGGPRLATTVLNSFITQIKPGLLLREVSMEMSGSLQLIHEQSTGASYRLFGRAVVNVNGSFYNHRPDPSEQSRYIGKYLSGTRSARALILLHEMAHLIRAENGAWLIPDDGNDRLRSTDNTRRVQRACLEQLELLK